MEGSDGDHGHDYPSGSKVNHAYLMKVMRVMAVRVRKVNHALFHPPPYAPDSCEGPRPVVDDGCQQRGKGAWR